MSLFPVPEVPVIEQGLPLFLDTKDLSSPAKRKCQGPIPPR